MVLPNRSLCPAEPSLQWVPLVSVPHLLVRTPCVHTLRYYAQLGLPIALPGFLRSSLVTQYLVPPLSFVSRFHGSPGRLEFSYPLPGLLFFVSTPHLLTTAKETMGSPKFPSYPRRYMPRSQTPVES